MRFCCREKVAISAMKAFVTVEGAGADKTVVQWGDTADTIGPKGQPLGTYNSATFAVNSAFFIAKNITFKVDFSLFDWKCLVEEIYLCFWFCESEYESGAEGRGGGEAGGGDEDIGGYGGVLGMQVLGGAGYAL